VKISDGGNCVSAVTAELLRLRLLVAAVDLWACRSAAANCCFLAAAAIASRTHSLHGLTRTHTASAASAIASSEAVCLPLASVTSQRRPRSRVAPAARRRRD